MNLQDTIVAVSSAVGPAARMIVRVAGPRSLSLRESVFPGVRPEPGAARGMLRFAGIAVPAWVYTFVGPRSYTGDDAVEFHLPGNPALCRMLVDALVVVGARHAEAGEFTARAFFNGRLDLTQAEGVAAVVGAAGAGELAAARRLLAGELSARLRPTMELIAQTLALVEVGIDFAEEDVSFLAQDQIVARARRAAAMLGELAAASPRFERLAHEPRIVLFGRPNAGKSTLVNALSRSARAVVSPIAGTTRDALSADVELPRGRVVLVDVAGIDAAGATPDAARAAVAQIEADMRRRAAREAEAADVLVLVRDATSDDADPAVSGRPPDLVVRTKIDLLPKTDRLPALPVAATDTVDVAAPRGIGLDALRAALDRVAFGGDAAPSALALNARHRAAIDEARAALDSAATRAAADAAGAEWVAADLRAALDALGRVLGEVTPDDILGQIFSSFCIGK